MPPASLFFAEALLPSGWVGNVRIETENGLINAITPDTAAQSGDETHTIALPGLPNLHSHAFQRGMAGLAETAGASEDSFWSWREVMYRFLAILTPGDVQAIAALAYAEMLEAGFTRVGEFHYLHNAPDGRPYANPAEMAASIAAAANETGIGLTLLPVLYTSGNFGGAAPTQAQRRFITTQDQFTSLMQRSAAAIAPLPDAVIGTAPHSLRAVTPGQLAHAVALAEGGPVHIHAAEQSREVEDCLAWGGARPVDYLLDTIAIGPNWCVVHATHMTDAEAARLARSGATAGLCPITEANLGDGIFNAEAFRGGRYGIGTDSNIQITAAGELRMLEYAQRLATRRRNVLAAGASTGRALFQSALNATALAASSGLRIGAAADFFAPDTAHPSLESRHGDGFLDAWIFATPGTVETVWRRGRKVVANGRHVDRPRIARAYRKTLNRLLSA